MDMSLGKLLELVMDREAWRESDMTELNWTDGSDSISLCEQLNW